MTAVLGITLLTALALGTISVVALVLRFRRAGAVQREQTKWFAYGAAPSVPLGMFAQARPYGPYLEFLGAALQLAGLGIGSGSGISTGWSTEPWSTGCSPCCSAPSTPGWPGVEAPGAADA